MTDKEITLEDLEESAKQTEEQLDLMAWKVDDEKGLVVPVSSQDMCVMTLLKSVSEVRSDYRALRRELGEVQQLQRELSARLRAQLRAVHGKFARLRRRLAAADRLQHQRSSIYHVQAQTAVSHLGNAILDIFKTKKET